MAAQLIGKSENERVCSLASMLAAKLPDTYWVVRFADGFEVYKPLFQFSQRRIESKEFHRLANFSQNHNLDASVGIIVKEGDNIPIPSVTFRIKE